jgi:hypothetical protein
MLNNHFHSCEDHFSLDISFLSCLDRFTAMPEVHFLLKGDT